MCAFGVAAFFSFVKLFEFIRLSRNLSTMNFIILGMMSKLMTFLIIIILVLIAFSSLNYLAFGLQVRVHGRPEGRCSYRCMFII